MTTAAPIHTLRPQKGIIAPTDGWKAHTLYLVRVAFNINNPVHEAYLKVGFLYEDKTPGSYTELFSSSYDKVYGLSDVYYLAPIKVLHTEEEVINVPLTLETK